MGHIVLSMLVHDEKRMQAIESKMCHTVCLNAFADGNVDSGSLMECWLLQARKHH